MVRREIVAAITRHVQKSAVRSERPVPYDLVEPRELGSQGYIGNVGVAMIQAASRLGEVS